MEGHLTVPCRSHVIRSSRRVQAVGGRELDKANAVPSVQLAIPRPAVGGGGVSGVT